VIDLSIVAFYLISLLLIGIYTRSRKSGFKSFASVKGKDYTHSKLILVATIFASTIGGGTTFGISEKAFATNIAHSYGLVLAIPIDIIIAIYIIPRLIKHYGTETIGDIMFSYYGKVGRAIGGFSAILVSIGLVAAQISVSARIFEYILQIDYIKGVIISYGIIIIYTTVGGFRSVLFTNQIQFFAMLIAIPIISIFGLYQIGISEFIQKIPPEKFIILGNDDLIKTTISAFLGFAVMNMFPTFIQRALIDKDSSQTTKAIYLKSVLYAIFLIFITINGLIAFILYPEIKPSLALPYLIDHIIPVGVQGVVIAGLLAAVMSTADSDLNITSITLVKDFFKPIFNLSNQGKMLIVARITNIIIGSLAIFIALRFNSVVDLVIFIAGFWGPIILVPLIFGLYDITIPKFALIFTCFSGGTSFLLWEYFMAATNNLKSVFVGTLMSFIVFMIFVIIKRFLSINTPTK
jgi:solute:Na+ symporter, SSS family